MIQFEKQNLDIISLPLLLMILVGIGFGLWVSSVGLGVETEISHNLQWAEQAFGEQKEIVTVSTLEIIHEDAEGDTKFNHCAAGGALRLQGKTYQHGIGVNSKSILRVTLSSPGERFLADIGLDSNVSNFGSVRFNVHTDSKDLFSTPIIRPENGMQSIDVPLNGVKFFELIVDDGGDGRGWDQANWADARVILSNGTELWLDEIAQQAQINTDLPFSFIYNDKHSSQLIPYWDRRVVAGPTDETSRHRTLILTDPNTQLEVRAEVCIYTDSPGVDWTLFFTNKGKQDTAILKDIKALDVNVSLRSMTSLPVLHRLNTGVKDWTPFDEDLPVNASIEFEPLAGRSSMGSCPFFNLDWGGQGVITAIGWTGQWAAAVKHTRSTLRLQAGMKHTRLKLHPGETIRAPRILQLYWTRPDHLESYNLFRRTMFNHIMPNIDGKVATPPIAHLSTAFYECDKGTEETTLTHLNSDKGMGFEFFWYDAYYGKQDFPFVGHYVFPLIRGFNKERFPRGMKPIGVAVRQTEMKFLMWFEPERICAGTLMATEHPEWVLSPENDGNGLFNLANPQAREHITRYLNESIKEYGISCLRIDNAVLFDPVWRWQDQQQPDRIGIGEIEYVTNLYGLWDDILKTNPHLFIDNCASGGHRIDLETCSRSIPLWRTDHTIVPLFNRNFNQAAMQNQAITAGLSRYVPFSTSGQMGATPYLFRSGVNGGGISFCEDIRPTEYPRELLKQGIAEAKRIRKYYFGNMYWHSPVTTDPRDWCILQYHRTEENDGMVIAFRRHNAPYASYVLWNLKEIDMAAEYEVIQYRTYDPEKNRKIKGSELLEYKIEINECPGSALIEYRKI